MPESDPLSERTVLSLDDLNGKKMLLFEEIGFWKEIVDRKMPDSRFLIQNDRSTFEELIENSNLPSFATDLRRLDPQPEKRCIPISDPDCQVQYYLVYNKKNHNKFKSAFPM